MGAAGLEPGLVLRDSLSNPAGPSSQLLPHALDRRTPRSALCPVFSALCRPYTSPGCGEKWPQAPSLLGSRLSAELAAMSAVVRAKSTPLDEPPARQFPVFTGYCGAHSADFGLVWTGDLGRSGAAARTALASWRPDTRCARRVGANRPCMCVRPRCHDEPPRRAQPTHRANAGRRAPSAGSRVSHLELEQEER